MSGIQDAEEYFDLIAEVARKYMESMPAGSNPIEHFRKLVGGEWRNAYQHMTRPDPRYGVWATKAAAREMANRYAALGRAALMAAWWFGINPDDPELAPSEVASRLAEMKTDKSPLI